MDRITAKMADIDLDTALDDTVFSWLTGVEELTAPGDHVNLQLSTLQQALRCMATTARSSLQDAKVNCTHLNSIVVRSIWTVFFQTTLASLCL